MIRGSGDEKYDEAILKFSLWIARAEEESPRDRWDHEFMGEYSNSEKISSQVSDSVSSHIDEMMDFKFKSIYEMTSMLN